MTEISRERLALRCVYVFPNEFRTQRCCPANDRCVLRRVMSRLVIIRKRFFGVPLGHGFVATLGGLLRAFRVGMQHRLYLRLLEKRLLG